MAPRFDNFLDGSVGGLGGAMGQYFKWNFSQSPAGISTYSAGVNAGLRPSTAFGTSLLTTAGLQYATNAALVGRDRESKKPTFGDSYGLEDQAWDSTVGVILPNQGKVPRNYADYTNQVKKNNGTAAQTLSQDAYNNWKDAEFNQGGIFRINREGQGSEIVGRDTATLFNRTVANPLYAYDGSLGRENVDRLTAGVGLASLGGSAAALKNYTDLAKVGATVGAVPAYTASQTAGIVGGSILKGLGVGATVYGGITDFAESKKAGDSDLRAATNATSNVAGGLTGAWAGTQATTALSAPLLATPLAPAVPFIVGAGAIAGGITGSGLSGWASDRVLDLFGEGKKSDNGISADTAMANAEARYQKALQANNQQSTNTMATPNNRYNNQTGKTVINSNKAAEYAKGEKLASDQYSANVKYQSDIAGYQIKSMADLQNYQMQSSDRRYNTDVTSNVNLQLGSQKNNFDYQAKTYDSQLQSGDRQFKTLAELQAALDSNQRIERVGFDKNRVTGIIGLDANAKNLEGSKFETTTKYGTQERINQYNRNTLDQTAIAEAQIKSGTYGMSKDDMAKRANDKANFDNWKARNDANFDYADRTNAQIKFNKDMANAERAYSDQRLDRQNDRAAAMSRFQVETYQKDNDRNRYYSDLAVQRQQTRDDFNLRTRQIQNQIDIANRQTQNQIDIANKDYAIRYGDASLRQQQYAATRADIGYNRSNQSSSLAF